MSLKEFFADIDSEVAATVGSDFKIEITDTRHVPNFDDSAITFDNFDEKKKKCKRLESCVLYVDLRDSVRMSASKRPETLAKTYSAFIRSMVSCAQRYKGHVRNIVGDRVMVVFDHDDCFQNAVNTAVLMNTTSKYILNKRITSSTITCGIGIDYGKMLITKSGSIRHGAEKEFYRGLVWLGKPANIASRLTDIAAKTRHYEKPIIKQGNYYKHTDSWLWLDKTYDEFIDDLEKTHTRMLEHKDPYFCSFYKFSISHSLKCNPILMTKAVYQGYKKACPNDNSITNNWWRKENTSARDYNGDVYGGDIIFTDVKEKQNMGNNFQVLEMILNQANSWVMYAEAKNGVTLALSGAVLIGTFEVVSSNPVENIFLYWYLAFVLLQVFAALILSLLSFIPRMELPWWVSFPDKAESDNPLFFGHACKYSPGLYLLVSTKSPYAAAAKFP